jgi:hypothetical protein
MVKSEEIISEIRNKMQASCTVIEQLSQGKPVPENLINIAKSNVQEIEKLLSEIEVVKIVQSKYERSL